jgi:hypothetical protein
MVEWEKNKINVLKNKENKQSLCSNYTSNEARAMRVSTNTHNSIKYFHI